MKNIHGLVRAYGRIRELYVDKDKKFMRNRDFRMNHNPVKQAFEIAGTKDCVLKSTNIMYATLPSGNIAKVISIDDVTGITEETVIYTDRMMRTTVKQNIGLTAVRCGIMAVLSADLNYKVARTTKVGFIGNGNINQKTMETLRCMFGIDSCVIRGSKHNRAKNKEKFEKVAKVTVDDTEDCRLLNECEIVFVCTSSYKKEDMISSDQLNDVKLLIVQDGGYILDESFRNDFFRLNYTDHEEQLSQHFKSEFPHDKHRSHMATMGDKRHLTCKKAVYLYGVAIADLIVFEELFMEGSKC